MLYFTCWFYYPVTSGGRLALQFFALSSHLFCSTTFFQVTYVYIKQPVVLNPISKCNVLVFIGDFPPLVTLMTNSYFVPVLLTSYWFMQGLQWGLFSFMRSKPDQTQVDQNCLMSFTIVFTDFFKEYLRVCGTGFPLVKSRESYLAICPATHGCTVAPTSLPYGHYWSEVSSVSTECFVKISIILVTFHSSSIKAVLSEKI